MVKRGLVVLLFVLIVGLFFVEGASAVVQQYAYLTTTPDDCTATAIHTDGNDACDSLTGEGWDCVGVLQQDNCNYNWQSTTNDCEDTIEIGSMTGAKFRVLCENVGCEDSDGNIERDTPGYTTYNGGNRKNDECNTVTSINEQWCSGNTQAGAVGSCSTSGKTQCLDPVGSNTPAFCAQCNGDEDCSGASVCAMTTGVCVPCSTTCPTPSTVSCGVTPPPLCSGGACQTGTLCNTGTCSGSPNWVCEGGLGGTNTCELPDGDDVATNKYACIGGSVVQCDGSDGDWNEIADCEEYEGKIDPCDGDVSGNYRSTNSENAAKNHCADCGEMGEACCQLNSENPVACSAGTCGAGNKCVCTQDSQCSDGNSCTDDTCSSGVCSNTPNTGNWCGSGTVCSTGADFACSYTSDISILEVNRTCNAGSCVANMSQVINSSVDVCTSEEICEIGARPRDCTTCTSGACDPVGGSSCVASGGLDQPCNSNGSCNSPYTCSSSHICVECSIEELFWERNGKRIRGYAAENQIIKAVVRGIGCTNSNQVDFDIMDQDDKDIADGTESFSNNKSTFDWTAELPNNKDAWTYYFEATLGSGSPEGSLEENNVTIVEACRAYETPGQPDNFIDSCSDYSSGPIVGEVSQMYACLSDCADVIRRHLQSGPNGEVGECVWTNNKCSFGYTPYNASAGADYYCRIENLALPECSEDQSSRTITVNYLVHNVTTGVESNNSAICHGTGACSSSSTCDTTIPCPKVVVLPFFTWVNALAILVLIAVVYVVNHYASRGKKKRKR